MDALAALPWPNVRGKRCLGIAPDHAALQRELEARGARTVEASAAADAMAALADAEPYDVIVAGSVLASAPEPLVVAHALHAATRGVLVSWEPIDLDLSLAGR